MEHNNANANVKWQTLLDELEEALHSVQAGNATEIIKARICRDVCREYFEKLKTALAFDSPADEMEYFRDIKPGFYSKYIYYGELFHILINDLGVSSEVQERYFRKHLSRLNDFLEWHGAFYKYYRSGLHYLDRQYFVKQPIAEDYIMIFDFVDIDLENSTGFDYLLSKIMAYEMLSQFLNERLLRLKEPTLPVPPANTAPTTLVWTAPKVTLVEYIYALHASGVFNNSQADIKLISETFSHLFGIPLKNIYKIWEEIRLRQKNRTAGIDALKANLLRKMDEDDEAAK